MRQPKPFRPNLLQPTSPESSIKSSRLVVLRKSFLRHYHRFYNIFFFAAGILAALLALFVYNSTKPPAQHLTQRDINAAVVQALATMPPTPSFESQVYEIIQPSVVLIQTTFLSKEGKSEIGLGSGVIADDSGTILTCLHVVQDADEINVTFADGSVSGASVILV